jgi:hypothetical protein
LKAGGARACAQAGRRIRSKEIANRPADHDALPELHRLLARQQSRDRALARAAGPRDAANGTNADS